MHPRGRPRARRRTPRSAGRRASSPLSRRWRNSPVLARELVVGQRLHLGLERVDVGHEGLEGPDLLALARAEDAVEHRHEAVESTGAGPRRRMSQNETVAFYNATDTFHTMSVDHASPQLFEDPDVHRRRWLLLGVMCLSLVLVVMSVSSLNVAAPRLQQDLGATATQLHWIIDSYALVFAGLLLSAGALGDRFGRKGALLGGLGVFGVGLVVAGLATPPARSSSAAGSWASARRSSCRPRCRSSPRCSRPRSAAGPSPSWAGFAGAGAAIGPVVAGRAAGGVLVGLGHPREPAARGRRRGGGRPLLAEVPRQPRHAARPGRLGPGALRDGGAALRDHRGRRAGWTDGLVLGAFAAAAVLIAGFLAWEARTDAPDAAPVVCSATAASASPAPPSRSRSSPCSASTSSAPSTCSTSSGYSPLDRGLAGLPLAGAMIVVAPRSVALGERFGAARVIDRRVRPDGGRARPVHPDRRRHAVPRRRRRLRAARRRAGRHGRPGHRHAHVEPSRSTRPASARRSTTRPASSAAPSASPCSARSSARPTGPTWTWPAPTSLRARPRPPTSPSAPRGASPRGCPAARPCWPQAQSAFVDAFRLTNTVSVAVAAAGRGARVDALRPGRGDTADAPADEAVFDADLGEPALDPCRRRERAQPTNHEHSASRPEGPIAHGAHPEGCARERAGARGGHNDRRATASTRSTPGSSAPACASSRPPPSCCARSATASSPSRPSRPGRAWPRAPSTGTTPARPRSSPTRSPRSTPAGAPTCRHPAPCGAGWSPS